MIKIQILASLSSVKEKSMIRKDALKLGELLSVLLDQFEAYHLKDQLGILEVHLL